MPDGNSPTIASPISATPNATTSAQDPIRPPTPEEKEVIDAADLERKNALATSLSLVDGFVRRVKQNPEASGTPEYSAEDQRTFDKLCYWLYQSAVGPAFWDAVGKFRDLMARNLALGVLPYSVDTVTLVHAYVYADSPAKGIFLCSNVYFADNELCRREVILHEYFHLVGLGHHYDADNTGDALKCAHHMAELTFDIATGCTGGCKADGGVCR